MSKEKKTIYPMMITHRRSLCCVLCRGDVVRSTAMQPVSLVITYNFDSRHKHSQSIANANFFFFVLVCFWFRLRRSCKMEKTKEYKGECERDDKWLRKHIVLCCQSCVYVVWLFLFISKSFWQIHSIRTNERANTNILFNIHCVIRWK